MFPSSTLNVISGGRPRKFRFHPRAVVIWRGGGGRFVSGCPPQHQPSSFFLLISSLLPGPPPSMSSFHSPLAGNESCCLWCEGEPGGGNNGAERKCQPQCTRIRAHFCVFSMCVCVCVCVCVPSHGLLKIPFAVHTHTHTHTHTHSPFEPLQRN